MKWSGWSGLSIVFNYCMVWRTLCRKGKALIRLLLSKEEYAAYPTCIIEVG